MSLRSHLLPIGIAGDVDREEAEQKMTVYRDLVKSTGVTDPKCISNADETGLLFRCMPTFYLG